MKKILQKWLNSKFTPIACLAIVSIENEFTYAIPGTWLLRVLELVICVFGLIAAVRNYSSWFRVITAILLAVGILSAAIEIPRSIRESEVDTDTWNPGSAAYSRSTGASSAIARSNYGYYALDYSPEWPASGAYSNSKVVCHVCNGGKACKECNGTGRIAIQKQSINLGNGGTTYNELKLPT